MKLSTKSRYALRILLQIAFENLHGNKLAQGRIIASKQDITEPYLEQIMIPLKKGGLVETVRGCNGGYKLKKLPEDINILEIIELFDGPVSLSACKISTNQCKRIDRCIASNVWDRLSKVFKDAAQEITLSSILEDYMGKVTTDYII
jgi:Rrf2 family protein